MKSEMRGGPEMPPARKNSLEELQERDTKALMAEQEADIEEAARKIPEGSAEEEEEVARQWESLDAYMEASGPFLDNIDKCWELFYENHKGEKKHRRSLETYDRLMNEIRQAIRTLVEDTRKAQQEPKLRDYAGAVLLEGYVDLVSDLCKKAYKIDKTFPDFKLLNEERFMEAISKEIRKGSEDAENIESVTIKERVGRFVTVKVKKGGGYSDDHYIMDQQAKKITNKDISGIERSRNGLVNVRIALGILRGNIKSFLFKPDIGEFSEGYDEIKPTIGNLWLGRQRINDRDYFTIFDAKGAILHADISEYVANKNKDRALIKTDWFRYNVVLEDGSLLFKDDEMYMHSNRHDVISGSFSSPRKEAIVGNIILGHEDKFVRLNPDLEIVAEGASAEEVEEEKVA